MAHILNWSSLIFVLLFIEEAQFDFCGLNLLKFVVCPLCRDDSIFDGLMEEDEKDKAKR